MAKRKSDITVRIEHIERPEVRERAGQWMAAWLARLAVREIERQERPAQKAEQGENVD